MSNVSIERKPARRRPKPRVLTPPKADGIRPRNLPFPTPPSPPPPPPYYVAGSAAVPEVKPHDKIRRAWHHVIGTDEYADVDDPTGEYPVISGWLIRDVCHEVNHVLCCYRGQFDATEDQIYAAVPEAAARVWDRQGVPVHLAEWSVRFVLTQWDGLVHRHNAMRENYKRHMRDDYKFILTDEDI